MSDISGLNTFSSGTATDSSAVNENFYGKVGTSYRVINGHLDNDNRDSSWTIGEDQIRDQAVANGRMVGATGNLDYVGRLSFPANNDDPEAFVAIPGASISFYLPYDCSAVMLTWLICGATNLSYDGTTVAEMKMYFDESAADKQFRTLPRSRDPAGSPVYWLDPRYPHRDRFWNGHLLKQNVSKGWHSASIRLFTNGKEVRVRIRNMKVVYFK